MRISWDTNVKHYVRSGLYLNLPSDIKNQISSSNLSRWKNEPNDKYIGSELAKYIDQDIALYKRIGQNSNIKKINESYFKLVDVLHETLYNVGALSKKLQITKILLLMPLKILKKLFQ